jgi:acyl-CoA synthetase (AMP-forming)/AMP-acid ligase II
MSRPPPTTFEQLELIALREPQRLALVENRQSWTYEAVYRDLVRIIRVLDATGIRRGDRVAVGVASYRLGLLLLFALENLGAATVSFLPKDDPDAQAVFAMAAWVLTDFAHDVPAPARRVLIDAAFLERVSTTDAGDPDSVPRNALALDEPQRFTRTSGSTGKSKFMLFRRHTQELWTNGVARAAGITAGSRVLIVGPLVLNGQYARASACLRVGAAVFELSESGLQGHDLTHLSALPVMLDGVLRSLPPGYAPQRAIHVSTVGATLSKSLRERTVRAFGGPVLCRYGMNEAGSISEAINEDGIGPLAPGTDVRIVDDAGNDVPPGQPGIIFVRTPVVVEGYLDNPEATKRAFHDGWFLTGDWGAMIAPRVIRVAGRYDDLINAGGIKLPASDVEAQVRALVAPRDCAVLATNLDAGEASMGIALVMDGNDSRDEIRRKLASGLKLLASTGARVLFLPQIPRLTNSKVDRVQLQRMFESPPPGSV